MSFFINRPIDYKSFVVTVTTNGFDPADYPVMLVYRNDALYSTHVLASTVTIGGVEYNTSSGADDLLFVLEDSGEYTFTLTSDVMGVGTDLVLADGVYQVTLLTNVAEGTDIIAGRVMDKALMCCVVDKWAELVTGCNNCPDDEVMAKVNKIYMSAKASDFAAQQLEFENAICMYNAAAHLCDSSCGCGCS